MPTHTAAIHLTLTAVAFRTGAHSRHKELTRALLAAGEEVFWIGPSSDDVSDLPGIVYLPLLGRRWLRAPLLGRIISYLLSLLHHRKRLRRVSSIFVFGDLELLAVRLFPPLRDRVVSLVLRNDLVNKARARAELDTRLPSRWLNRLRAGFFLRLQRRLYPTATRLLVQTPAIAEELRRRVGPRLPPLHVVPNDCRPTWTRETALGRRRLWQQRPGQKLVGFVGNLLWEVKGLELLFATFGEIRSRLDARLIVVGGGADLDRVRQRAREERFRGAVEVVGPVSNASRLMGSFDLILVTSHYDDCPNVVLEALTARVPLVATNIDAHSYLLGEGLVREPMVAELAVRAVQLLTDPQARSRALEDQEERRRRFDFDWGRAMVGILRDTGTVSSATPGDEERLADPVGEDRRS